MAKASGSGVGAAYGRRLMPTILDDLAETDPKRLFSAVPVSADVAAGFQDVTVADTARCVNFMARWIEDKFGRSTSFETLSYIGIADMRGPITFLAAVKCGYKLLIPSPRNPSATNVSLMSQTGSVKLLHSIEVAPLVKGIQELEPNIQAKAMPSFAEMMKSTPDHYPYEKTFEEARDEPVVVLHSSGSTGPPKPITMTHGSLAVLDNEKNLRDLPGRRKRDWTLWSFEGEARLYTIFPFFHLGGFLMFTAGTIFGNSAFVFGPPNAMPDGSLLRSMMAQQKLRAMLLPPAVVEKLLLEPDGLDFFKGLDFLAYSGAPFNQAIGAKLNDVVELVAPFGSTETYPLPQLAPDREDWAWLEFHPDMKHEMQPFGTDEGQQTFELVIVADDSAKDTSAVYHNLPGIGKFHTKDLFVRHPEKAQLFKYYGRKDDILVLSNGEKFNPVPLELAVQGHPSLQGALVIGSNRTQTALLVEPKERLSDEESAALIKALWPAVEKANLLVAGQGRIHFGKVLCAKPDKPLQRTGKGTVARKRTEDLYSQEIEDLYKQSSGGRLLVDLKPSPGGAYEHATVVRFLREVLAASFPPGSSISESDDFFIHGLDSVQTIEIVANLKHNLQAQASKPAPWITPRVVFQNPTVDELAGLLVDFLNHGSVPSQDTDRAQADAVNSAVSTFMKLLPQQDSPLLQPSGPPPSPPPTTTAPSKVAIIGSTGYLGSHLVAKLLETGSAVSRIYCLDRSADAQQRQEQALAQLLPGDNSDSDRDQHREKLTYMRADLGGQPQQQRPLGLSESDHATLLAAEVDVVIFNAWRLDFGLSIRSFAPLLRALVSAVALATARRSRPARFLFISSVSSVGRAAAAGGAGGGGAAPEAVVEDPLAALPTGYAQSKLAAERVLAAAHAKLGLPVAVARVGQLGGPTASASASSSAAGSGRWADQPWLSALFKTAKAAGVAPADVAPVDWVPVDVAAAMLRDYALRPVVVAEGDDDDEEEGVQVYNVVHPAPQPWSLVLDVLREELGVNDARPLGEWTRLVQDLAAAKEKEKEAEGQKEEKDGEVQEKKVDVAALLPALKLLDFLGILAAGTTAGHATYATARAVKYSREAERMPALDKALVGRWIRSWDL
ncbi:acetyl-CoA synthetase-like protein [Xylariaceae sp. FL0804]|nr:acetyl-CoA synthetase-like protein [Xylariaceae sp. FL0804]